MDQLNLNMFLNREELETFLITNLNHFEENKNNLLTKRGFYIYGLWIGKFILPKKY